MSVESPRKSIGPYPKGMAIDLAKAYREEGFTAILKQAHPKTPNNYVIILHRDTKKKVIKK